MQKTTATILASSTLPEAPSSTVSPGTEVPARRTRRYRKRLRVGMPQHTAPAVRELWKSASAEERAAAHRKGVLMLALWLGRKTRAEVSSELSLPPLRVWQLSQMALSGMLAGLLKQPRHRRGKEAASMNEEESPSRLKKRIAQLEQENRDLKALLDLIKDLPSVEERPSRPSPAAEAGDSPGTKRTNRGQAQARSRAKADRRSLPPTGEAPLG